MGRLMWTGRQTQHPHCTYWLVRWKAGLTWQIYSNVTAEYVRCVLEGPWGSQNTFFSPRKFHGGLLLPKRNVCGHGKTNGQEVRGKQMEPSICWQVSPRTWLGQQKAGSRWCLHQNAYSMARKTWPLKRAGQAGTSLDHLPSALLLGGKLHKTAFIAHCFLPGVS